MKTIDIHTHLLNPAVKFERLFDRLAVRFFARRLGIEPAKLQAVPFDAYVQAMTDALSRSRHVEKACLFPVDARFDSHGRQSTATPPSAPSLRMCWKSPPTTRTSLFPSFR